MPGKVHLASTTLNYLAHSSTFPIQYFVTWESWKHYSAFNVCFKRKEKTVFFVYCFSIFIIVPCVKIVKNLFLYYAIYILSTSCLHIEAPIRNVFKEGSWLDFENRKNKRNWECQFPNFSTFQKEMNVYKNSFVLDIPIDMQFTCSSLLQHHWDVWYVVLYHGENIIKKWEWA